MGEKEKGKKRGGERSGDGEVERVVWVEAEQAWVAGVRERERDRGRGLEGEGGCLVCSLSAIA